ncbi:hypothetical protein [Stenotrophomonas sp. NA06056]|uniref:hypothetical protein n=1 Tax=Stenotrophomonas sp. NA06056 TaxID=2742129 RepID=UPI00158F155B|nr:hypothetical protein [Stenotrophomonas sp. NA06056]QKW56799.1 hypothetical protein HUT07_09285 [Stenotrophomonas sp. NA06056]
MTEPLLVLLLVGSVASISFGLVKLASWCTDRAGESSRRVAREAVFVAQARAELAATGWTAEEEAAFQAIRAQQGVSLMHLREARRA